VSTYDFDSSDRIFDSKEDRLPRLPVVAAWGSLLAAAIHAWVVRSHAAHWWGYAAFFAGLAVAQAVYAGVILRRPTRRLALAGIGANIAVLALYVWSRAVAVPIGPHAGRPETVEVPDLLAAGAELVVVVALAVIARGAALPRRTVGNRSALSAVVIALVAAGFAGPAGHAHPRPTEITLADGPETWVGPLPTPSLEPTPIAEKVAPTTEPEPAVGELPACEPSTAGGSDLPPASPGEARGVVSIVNSEAGSRLSMYVPSTDENRDLVSTSETCWITRPSFRDPGYVTFESGDAIYGLDISSGAVRKLVEGNVLTSAWSPDGKVLAYLTYDWDERTGPQLALYDRSDGSTEVVRTFEAMSGGRCGGEDDETTIAWAPDGHAMTVVMTFMDFTERTMYVVDRAGRDLVDPRFGTHAAWGPNSIRIYYRDFGGDRNWYALNSETGDRGTLGAMKPGTHGLAVSPDGSMLAYHDGEDDVGIYLYDVGKKEQRRLTEDAVAPVWIGPRTILATNTESCGNECFHSLWMSSDDGSKVDVFTERKQRVSLGSTLQAEAWIEPAAAAQPAPAPAPPSPSPTPNETDEPLPLPTAAPTESTEPTPSPSPTAST
jgi:hypothetical protein